MSSKIKAVNALYAYLSQIITALSVLASGFFNAGTITAITAAKLLLTSIDF